MTRKKAGYGVGIGCLMLVVTACGHRSQKVGLFQESDRDEVQRQYDGFLARAAADPGAVRTKSGVVYVEMERGGGVAPQKSRSVTVRYQVKDPNGTVIEDSTAFGGAITVPLERMPLCWREAVARMRVGGTSRFVCPASEPELRAAVQQGRALLRTFEVKLVDVGRPPLPRGH